MIFKKVMSIAAIGSTLALTSGMAQSALAVGFTSPYSSSSFTFNGVGSVDTSNAGTTGVVELVSPNGSVGDANWTIQITPERAGTISFSWAYDAFSAGNSISYLLNGTPILITSGATTGLQSSASPIEVLVESGDEFGFQASSEDTGGEAYFYISDFDFSPTAVPFEFSPTTGLLLLGGLGGLKYYRHRRQCAVKLNTKECVKSKP